MSVKFEIKTINVDECSSVSDYVSTDLSLEVRLSYNVRPMSFAKQIDGWLGIRDKRILLIFGSLTITFSGENLLLESIDSYTNNKKWLVDEVASPVTTDMAALTITTSSDDDRFSFDLDPVYVFDETKGLLLIKLSENKGTRFHRLTNNLIIGMTEEKLVSLFIENINIA